MIRWATGRTGESYADEQALDLYPHQDEAILELKSGGTSC
jgi:hypothetical protein